MALLNFGNAIAGFGKAAAAMGLDSVKAALEQDKVRLAADLAAQESLASDTRRTTAAKEAASLLNTNQVAAAGALVAADTAKVTEGRAFITSLADPKNAAGQAYLAGTKALIDADPAKQAEIQAARDTSALNVFKLKAATDLSTAQTELANATTPEQRQRAEQKVRGFTANATEFNAEGAAAGAAARLDEFLLRGLREQQDDQNKALEKADVDDKPAIRTMLKGTAQAIADQLEVLKVSNAFAKSKIPGYPTGPTGAGDPKRPLGDFSAPP